MPHLAFVFFSQLVNTVEAVIFPEMDGMAVNTPKARKHSCCQIQLLSLTVFSCRAVPITRNDFVSLRTPTQLKINSVCIHRICFPC